MPDILLVGAPAARPALRHELPLAIGDDLVLAVVGGRVHVATTVLELDRVVRILPDAEVVDMAELGLWELVRSGISREELDRELTSRAVARFGIREAVVPGDFPLAAADRLRADGVALVVDDAAVDARRRVKSAAELAGIRRAQVAAQAGMAAAARILAAAVDRDGRAVHAATGAAVTCEEVRAAIRAACAAHGAPASPDLIVASVEQGYGHDEGTGPLPARLPIQIDLWPRDEASGTFADMTRTYVVGDVPDAVCAQEALVQRALAAAREAALPGVRGRAVFDAACDVLEAAGWQTLRTDPDQDDPQRGMRFALGHGVGLDVHEAPGLGLLGTEPLVAGDVVAVEPGLWEAGLGGVRFEDLLRVAEGGAEVLTAFPYDLDPRVAAAHGG